MKFFVVLVIFVASSMAQRPSFAGTSPKGVPNLASRFKTNNSDNSASGIDLGNRVGVVDGTTERLPIDARNDAELVNRIKSWPRENWPYWYVNAEAIEKQRGGSSGVSQGNNNLAPNTQNQASQNGNQFQSRFGGSDGQSSNGSNNISFNVVINNQWKTYVYDQVADAWYPKRN